MSLSPTTDLQTEHSNGTVVWAAIFGGALTALGISFILSPIGSALGFGVAWPHGMEAGTAVTVAGTIWLIVVQWVASGFGGYLTGRLRMKWAAAHTHEVFFRDTVHGFLAWALGTVTGLLLLAVVFTPLAQGVMQRSEMHPMISGSYYTDALFRNPANPSQASAQDRAESMRIVALVAAGEEGTASNEDRVYLTELVAARTGLNAEQATRRVDTVLARAKAHMQQMHTNGAEASLFLAFALLIGAFISSAAAALGGRDRDIHYRTGKFY